MTMNMTTAPRRLRWVDEAGLAACKAGLSPAARDWVEAHGFLAERGRVLALPDAAGGAPVEVWVGLGSGRVDLTLALGMPDRLPAGDYTLDETLPEATTTTLALGFALGAYRFARYKAVAHAGARLVGPTGAGGDVVAAIARADALARDLINTPAQDMGPSELSAAVAAVAQRHAAQFEAIVGDDLLSAGYPAVHAVGRSGAQAPRLLTLQAGSTGPLVALVGKGVCFDTGGLDLKPASGMALMKKDMGGAAIALAVAELVLALELPVRLLLVIPAVENGVGPHAYRPGDVLKTRAGLTVEVTNTVWPMPLWRGYEDELQSRIADLQNASSSGFAGSITAGLFLRRFVPSGQHWIHLDLYAWNPKDRPGRPVGAEAHTLRAVVEWLQRRYRTALT